MLRRERGQRKDIFPVQLTTSRIDSLTRFIHTLLLISDGHTYIHIVFDILFVSTRSFKVSSIAAPPDSLVSNVVITRMAPPRTLIWCILM